MLIRALLKVGKMHEMSTLQIGVKGVITRDNRLLMLHKSDRDLWELPGGRIDEGEDDYEQMLARELNEELPGIAKITIGNIIHAHLTDFFGRERSPPDVAVCACGG
jgi:8-oxo-dGTP pyrophosphatase MutT (NUDIX family)